MVFHSYKFILLFLPALLVCYKLTEYGKPETRERTRSVLLLAASVLFISGYGLSCVLAVAASIAVNGLVARVFLCREGSSETDAAGVLRTVVFVHALVANIALLSFLKVFSFPLPVGLSFYTFTQISFLVDTYRGEIKSFTPDGYLLHVLFFPKFLQGPIMRMEETQAMVLSRLRDDMTAKNLLNGMLLFSLGLFKKTMLADILGNCVNTAYGMTAQLTRADALTTILVFTAQIYFDFSAYCDMGAGVAGMLGMDLPVNFLQPMRAPDIVSHWKRWHMSLTGFFGRYLYRPLGGSRKGTARRYLNILIVFLVSGFWHGTGVTFLVWGALHGLAYAAVTAIGAQKIPRRVGTLCTYLFLSFCFVFFRAETLADALQVFRQAFTAPVFRVSETVANTFYLDEIWYVVKVLPLAGWEYRTYLCMAAVLLAAFVLLFFAPDARTLVLRNDERMREGKHARAALFVLLCAVLFVWALVSTGEVATYLYVNF